MAPCIALAQSVLMPTLFVLLAPPRPSDLSCPFREVLPGNVPLRTLLGPLLKAIIFFSPGLLEFVCCSVL